MPDPREYDARRNPQRGVRIDPLPRYMHARFRKLLSQLRAHARSHKSTWQLANKSIDHIMVVKQLMFWSSALKYIDTIEYFGTHHDDTPSGT